jgi:hypothetical protein
VFTDFCRSYQLSCANNLEDEDDIITPLSLLKDAAVASESKTRNEVNVNCA